MGIDSIFDPKWIAEHVIHAVKPVRKVVFFTLGFWVEVEPERLAELEMRLGNVARSYGGELIKPGIMVYCFAFKELLDEVQVQRICDLLNEFSSVVPFRLTDGHALVVYGKLFNGPGATFDNVR